MFQVTDREEPICDFAFVRPEAGGSIQPVKNAQQSFSFICDVGDEHTIAVLGSDSNITVHDVSPTAEVNGSGVVIHLPTPPLEFGAVHTIEIALDDHLKIVKKWTTTVPSVVAAEALCFTAISRGLVAVGMASGVTRLIRLSKTDGGAPTEEFDVCESKGSWIPFMGTGENVPHVAALGCIQNHILIVLSADGVARFWDSRGGRLKAKIDLAHASHTFGDSAQFREAIAGSPCLIVSSPSGDIVSFVLGDQIFVVKTNKTSPVVGEVIMCPIEGVPRWAVQSEDQFWGGWQGPANEDHVFRFDLDSSGASGAEVVLTSLQQQQLRMIADKVSITDLLELFNTGDPSHQGPESFLDFVINWWVDHLLERNRIPRAALLHAAQTMEKELQAAGRTIFPADDLRARYAHLLRESGRTSNASGSASSANAESTVADTGKELLYMCMEHTRRWIRIAAGGLSKNWAAHMMRSDSVASNDDISSVPVLISSGGVSAIRPMMTWTERWWATLAFTDLTSPKIDIGVILNQPPSTSISDINDWKICAAAWYLMNCFGPVVSELYKVLLHTRLVAPAQAVQHILRNRPVDPKYWNYCQRAIEGLDLDFSSLLAKFTEVINSDPHEAPPSGSISCDRDGFRLSDTTRGSVTCCEANSLVVSIRDVLTLSQYMLAYSNPSKLVPEGEDNVLPVSPPASEFIVFANGQLHVSSAVSLSLMTNIEKNTMAGEVVRACDYLTRCYRSNGEAFIPSLASLQNASYLLALLKMECWEAIKVVTKYSIAHSSILLRYMLGRSQVVSGEYGKAHQTFLAAKNVAWMLFGPLDLPRMVKDAPEEVRATLAYLVHVAMTFNAVGAFTDELHFLQLAASKASVSEDCVAVQKKLWAAVFEKALQLSKTRDALSALLSLPEGCDVQMQCLRRLSFHLCSGGNASQMVGWKLPDALWRSLCQDLLEHAQSATPMPGTNSWASFRVLYALHATRHEYTRAALVAYRMQLALQEAAKSRFGGLAQEARSPIRRGRLPLAPHADPPAETNGDVMMDVDAGRNGVPKSAFNFLSAEAMNVSPPRQSGGLFQEQKGNFGQMVTSSGFEDQSISELLPLLQERQSALVLSLTALKLTDEGVLAVSATPSSSDMADPFGSRENNPMRANAFSNIDPMQNRQVVGTGTFQESRVAKDVNMLSRTMAITLSTAEQTIITAVDLSRQLSIIEGRILLAKSRNRIAASEVPEEVAPALAKQGLISGALHICRQFNIECWENAMKEYVHFIMQAIQQDNIIDRVLQCRQLGIPLTEMFSETDSVVPLHCGQNWVNACWKTLQDALEGFEEDQLYAHVTNEVLVMCRSVGIELPMFLQVAMATDSRWVTLLRLYMKHSRADLAVRLVERRMHEGRQRCPIVLLEQLRCALQLLKKEAQHGESEIGNIQKVEPLLEELNCAIDSAVTGEFRLADHLMPQQRMLLG